MIPSTALYKNFIHTPHKRVTRIDAFDIDGVVLAQDVPVIDGDVGSNLTNRVSRSATWSLPDEWYPRSPTDPFSQYVSVVRIRSGVEYGNGTEELFPLFTGRVLTAQRSAAGSVDFTADDLAADVVDYRFESPRTADRNSTVLTEIENLIREALPQAVFKAHGVADGPVPELTWDEDRGQALDDLASAVGGRWLADGEGRFSVQPIVYEPGTPVQDFLDGPGGLLSTADIDSTRAGSANSITIVSERTDGSDPIRITVRDTSPTSPTFFGGKFGKVSQIIKIQTPLTIAEAQRMARAYLEASVALTEQWTVSTVPDHTMETGDTARFRYRGLVSEQVIDSMVYPLGTNQPMTMNTRGTVRVTDS